MSAANGTASGGDVLQFDVGLISASSKKYLTTELGTVNVNGTSLKSKQVWTLNPATADGKLFFLSNKASKSGLITVYRLTYDKYGKVTAEKMDDETSPDLMQKFRVEPQGDGKFAIKAETLDYLSAGAEPTCKAKSVGTSETWSIQLAIHPQVNIFSVQRQQFAHLDLERERLLFNENIPWGGDAVMTLIWDAAASQYLIQAADDRFLNADGSLSADKSGDALFALEFHGEHLAFKNGGKYLSVGGKDGELMTRKGTVGKEALFKLEDSYPQGIFYNLSNNKIVSMKQDIHVSANQHEETDTETFQLECAPGKTNEWAVRSSNGNYWSMDSGKQDILNNGKSKSNACLFELVYDGLEAGTVALKAKANGKFVGIKSSGPLVASGSEVGKPETFRFKLSNRPNLVLKGEHGFIGLRKNFECNRTTVDNEVIQVSYENDGTYIFRGRDPNTAWTVDGEGNYTLSEGAPEKFTLEFMKRSQFLIRASNGKLLEGKQHGEMRATGTEMKKSTLWEF
ncbi:protein singed-like [Acanthaster planci]|uniref:Fascin n=1 Tax=Acanthaster planci TaxID=133434 RepID=A0A8B7YH65_ACAPL|nr:protein singed-like [Acanthaster planci]